MRKLLVLAVALLCAGLAVLLFWPGVARPTPTAQAQPQVLYSNDFEVGVGPEWSFASTTQSPSGRRFLGEVGSQPVGLTLSALPAHNAVTVSFDVYAIRSWDGNDPTWGPDIFYLSVASGPTLIQTTFSNTARQSYPDPYPGGDYPAQTGAVEVNTLGYTYYGQPMDSVYRLSVTFPHSDSSLTLNFSVPGSQGGGDETWGLDTVSVLGDLPQAQPTWQVVTIPSLPAGATLSGVWAAAPNDVYVSAYIPTDVPEGSVFHWNGVSWSTVLSLPGHSTGKVFGTGSSDVLALAYKCAAGSAAGCGADRGGRVFRSTDGGATWTPQVLPPEGVNWLGYISGTPGNVHVQAGSSIIRFDGSSWSTIFTTPGHSIQGLTVLGANEGYYVTCWGWGSWSTVGACKWNKYSIYASGI